MASGARISELNRFDVDIININNTAYDDLFIEPLDEIIVKGRGVNGKKIHRYILKDRYYYETFFEHSGKKGITNPPHRNSMKEFKREAS